ncbi:MAG: DNA polymerase III subunit beta [Patescibacteria group bacterium]
MKVKCNTEKLIIAISKIEKITSKNSNLPILSCILLEAKENKLFIRATNLDLGIEITLLSEIEKEGRVAVSGNILKNLLANISSSDNIILELKDKNLYIQTNNNNSTIKTQPDDDFPSIPKIQGENKLSLDNKKFIKGMKSVWYAASTSSIKPELSSVCINIEDNNLFFVATDSFRLAEAKFHIENIENIENILIPFKNIPEILRVFEDIDGNIEMEFNKNQIAIKYGSIYLTSRIIEGVFPDYKQLIPKDFITESVILMNDFVRVFKITNIFSDKFNTVNFNIDMKNKKFEVYSKSDEVGENKHQVSAVLSGDDLNINFNTKYITDCFQSINTDSIMLQFGGLNKPMVIRGVSDNQFTYLVMPMNK